MIVRNVVDANGRYLVISVEYIKLLFFLNFCSSVFKIIIIFSLTRILLIYILFIYFYINNSNDLKIQIYISSIFLRILFFL